MPLPLRALGVLVVLVALAGCAETSVEPRVTPATDPPGEVEYEARIRWTSHGIPHIEGESYGDVAFGQGWALAHDHACTLADQIVKVRGERARHFGPGRTGENVDSDVAYRALGLQQRAWDRWQGLSREAREVLAGFAAGYNEWLEETGVDDVPGWCAGQDWVAPIELLDLLAYHEDLALLASGRNFVQAIGAAQPPTADAEADAESDAQRDELAALLGDPPVTGSGWALGSRATGTEHGMLLADARSPWEGELRFWESHLRVPGELDVYGATLVGLPMVLVGFNDAVAWTQTVAGGQRYSLYALDLVDGEPTSYHHGDDVREMSSREIEVAVRQPDGSMGSEVRTVWSSHHGPVLDLPGLGWSEQRAIAYRDAAAGATSLVEQLVAAGRAQSLQDLEDSREELGAMPWMATVAAAASGRVWFDGGAATPQLPSPQGAAVLDGSDPDTDWVDEAGAAGPGSVPWSELPRLQRRDWVGHTGGTHWIVNPRIPLTGYSPLVGAEAASLRPQQRQAMTVLSELAGAEGEWERPLSLADLQEAILEEEAYLAALLRDELVGLCSATGSVAVPERLDSDGELLWEAQVVDLAPVCDVLRRWDGTYALDRQGAVIFYELLSRLPAEALREAGLLFSVPFDPDDPVDTPSGLAEPLLVLLGEVVLTIEAAGFAVDDVWRDVQWTMRGTERIPIHGGGPRDGTSTVVGFDERDHSLERGLTRKAPLVEGGALSEEGLVVNSGPSFRLAVSYTDNGPVAEALLSHGQSGDRGAPFYADQMYRFSDSAWRPVRVTAEDVRADTVEELVVRTR